MVALGLELAIALGLAVYTAQKTNIVVGVLVFFGVMTFSNLNYGQPE